MDFKELSIITWKSERGIKNSFKIRKLNINNVDDVNHFIKSASLLKPWIYIIKCKVNNKIYIWKSKNMYSRCKSHLWLLKKWKHKNFLLQKDYDKFWEWNFYFDVLEECDANKLTQKEIEYILSYKESQIYNIEFTSRQLYYSILIKEELWFVIKCIENKEKIKKLLA